MRNIITLHLAAVSAAMVSFIPSVMADIPASAYIQDGLVAQWDALENAGAGTHSSDTNEWVDLKGNYNLAFMNNGNSWLDDAFVPASSYLCSLLNTSLKSFSLYKSMDLCVSHLQSNPGGSQPVREVLGYAGRTFVFDWANSAIAPACGIGGYLVPSLDPSVNFSVHASYVNNAATPESFYSDGVEITTRTPTPSPGVLSCNDGFGCKYNQTFWTAHCYFHAVRLYNREIKPWEVMYNANLDRMRYFDVAEGDLAWNEVRWNSAAQRRDFMLNVTAADGGSVAVKVDGVDVTCPFWTTNGAVVSVVVTAPVGKVFKIWTGDDIQYMKPANLVRDSFSFTVVDPCVIEATFATPSPRHWRGTSSALASEAANWYENTVPVKGDSIILDADSGNTDMTWDLPNVIPSNWTQSDYTGTVTFKVGTSRSEGGSADDDGNRELYVSGNITLNSGTWTHASNTSLAQSSAQVVNGEGNYRLFVNCGGNMTIGANAKLDVSRKGFGKTTVHLSSLGYEGNGCYHGGSGNYNQENKFYGFGSVLMPLENTSGGESTHSDHGTGVIRLKVAGTLTVNGMVTASGGVASGNSNGTTYPNWYATAGGSICLLVGRLEGAGTIKANGGRPNNNGYGGGGRIAVYLNTAGSTYGDFTGTIEAHAGGPYNTSASSGPAGTIYVQLPTDSAGHGELIVSGVGTSLGRNQGTFLSPWNSETNWNFRKISLSGKSNLLVMGGGVLDLTGTEIANNGDNTLGLCGGKLILPDNEYTFTAPVFRSIYGKSKVDSNISFSTPSGKGTLVINSGTALIERGLYVNGSMRIGSGGTVSHTTVNDSSSTNRYWTEIVTTDDFTIDAGGKIDVNERGTNRDNGLGRATSGSGGGSYGGGASHGGVGGYTTGRCYGDIVNPFHPGSGGYVNDVKGGGVAVLRVGGTATINGTISAQGKGHQGAGSGGTVNITAGEIAGTGTISANGGFATANGKGGGGGGRVAIKLTKTGATVDAFRASATVSAWGGYNDNATYAPTSSRAGSGTVYYRNAGQADDEGTLVIDNGGTATVAGSAAEIVSTMTGRTFGNVELTQGGSLYVRRGEILQVRGNWTNDNTCAFGGEPKEGPVDGGAVEFIDASRVSTVTGSNDFMVFRCYEPDKVIRFGSTGSNLGVTEEIGVDGGENHPVVLRGIDNDVWTMSLNSEAKQLIDYAAVSNSNASAGAKVVPKYATDLGGNVNWDFAGYKPAGDIYWTGALGVSWSAPGNWSLGRAPIDGDRITIPAGCEHMPVFESDATVGNLTVESGATLYTAGYNLTITGNLSVCGTLSSTTTITVGGPFSQTLDFGNGNYHNVVFAKTDGNLSVTRGFTAKYFTVDSPYVATYTFTPGLLISAEQVRINGTAASAAGLTLASATSGAAWRLVAGNFRRAAGLIVSDCDSSGGIEMRCTIPCTDGGRNVNWVFGQAEKTWIGASNGDFAIDSNWADNAAPVAGDRVVFNGGETITLSANAEVGDVECLAGSTVINASNGAELTIGGELEIAGGAKLTLDPKTTVSGSAFVRSGGILTHVQSTTSSAALHRLDLAVGGDMIIEPNAFVDGLGKGWNNGQTYPGVGNFYHGGFHGGTPQYNMSVASQQTKCYGSLLKPVTPGGGGSPDHGAKKGGGIIRLDVTGNLVNNGVITAQAWTNGQHYGCSGGSVWINAKTLTGSGDINANGGTFDSVTTSPGGGGRVAIYLTSQKSTDQSNWTGTVRAYSGVKQPSGTTPQGTSGTVYWQYADEKEGCGTCVIDGGNTGFTTQAYGATIGVPESQGGDPLKDIKNVRFVLKNNGRIFVINNPQIGDIDIADTSTARINVYGGQILTVASPVHKNGKGWKQSYATVVRNNSEGGKVDWKKLGTLLIMR